MLQQRIARPLDGFGRRRPQAVLLRPADGVERVGSQPFDVKPVVDHPCLRHPRPHRLAVARRQVRRHQFDPGTTGRSQQLEELVQRLGAAPRPGPDYAAAHRRPRNPHQTPHRRPVGHLRQIRRQLLERRRERAAVGCPGHLAGRRLTGRALSRRLVLAMIKRRAAAANLPPSTCWHTFRATGITAYLSNGGTLEHAQQIAGHASPKTTKL